MWIRSKMINKVLNSSEYKRKCDILKGRILIQDIKLKLSNIR